MESADGRKSLLNGSTIKTALFTLIILFFTAVSFGQTTLTSRVSGNWNAATTWMGSNLTGTITSTTGSVNVTGVGTSFNTQLVVGQPLYRADGTLIGTVQTIPSATSLTLSANAANANAGASFRTGKVPGSLDSVIISNGFAVTIPGAVAASCATLELGITGVANSESLTFSASTSTFTSTGNVNILANTGNATKTLAVGAGQMTIGGTLEIGKGGQGGNQGNRESFLTLGSGTVNVSGNLILDCQNAVQTVISFSNIGVINLAGSFTLANNPGTLTPGTGTFNYNGGNQSIQTASSIAYNNLSISGSGTKTAGANFSIGGNLNINPGASFSSSTNVVSLAGNWVNNGTFEQTASTINLNGSGAQSIGGANGTVFNNLTINKSAGLASILTNANVNGTLTLTSGNLDITDKNLTLGANPVAGTFSATRMIYASNGGELRRTYSGTGSYVFPVGETTGTAEYSPVTVNVTGGSFSGGAYVGVGVGDLKHPNNGSPTHFLTRYWKVNQSGITGALATITGTYINTAVDVTGTLASIKAGQLNGTFSQTANPWIKFAALSGSTLTATGATLTSGQASYFTGITSADPTVTVSVTGGSTVCTNAAVTLTAVPAGSSGYSYLWSNALGTASTATPSTVSPGSVNYTVTVYDVNGISASGSSNITVKGNYPFFADTDGDGYGAGNSVSLCSTNGATPPSGYTLNNSDCNDSSASVYQSAALYIDVDSDGYNNGTSVRCYGASVPAGYSLTTNGTDCNDNSASVYQSASLYVDADGDGYNNGSSVQCYGASVPVGYSLTTNGGDCNDINAAMHASYSFYADTDGDTYGAGSLVSVCAVNALTAPAGHCLSNSDCNDNSASVYQSAALYIDVDNDGYNNGTSLQCYGASVPAGYSLTTNGTDCNDNSVSVYQSSVLYVDADGDGYNNGTSVQCYGTSVPSGYSLTTNGGDCNDINAAMHASYSFYVDTDGDTYGAGSLVSACAIDGSTVPTGYSLSNSDCNDNSASVYQSAALYIDVDVDGYNNGTSLQCYGASVPAGYSLTTNGTDCNDNSASVYQSAALYIDVDVDGYNNGSSVQCYGASVPVGYSLITNGGDCNDVNAAMHASYSFYADTDGDTFGAGSAVSVCAVDALTAPTGHSVSNSDCDDNSASVYQSAALYIDVDDDGYNNGTSLQCYGASVPAGYSLTTNGGDCNDINAAMHASYSFYADTDGDTYGAGSVVSVCAVDALTAPTGHSVSNSDCDDNSASVYQSAALYIDVDDDGYNNGTSLQCYGASVPAGYSLTTNGGDCNDTNAAKHSNYPFYADADSDGYGAAGSSAVSVCAVNAATAPGYSVNSTDCDDSRPTVYPGATEIAYDLIDNDCDGFTDEGFPAIVTSVQTVQCDATLSAIDSYVYANLVAGAQGYSWKVTTMSGPNTGQIQYANTFLRNLKITSLSNYAFNTTYKVEVGVLYNGFLQPYTAPGCSVKTPTTTTHLVSCGSSLTALTDVIYANIVPFATGYRFKVTNNSNSLDTQTIDRQLREFRMSLLTNIQYNSTYTVEVSLRNTDGSYLPYGPLCTVATPVFPTTQIQSSNCELAAVPSISTIIYADAFSGAQGYRFELTNISLAYSQTVDRILRTYSLSNFTGLVPGATYTVRVSLKLNGIYGPYGKSCTVIVPGAARFAETAVPVDENVFKVVAYPNPFASSFKLEVNSSNGEREKVTVYDMIGRMIEVRAGNVAELNTQEIGKHYPSGVYNIVVTQGEHVKALRVIKR